MFVTQSYTELHRATQSYTELHRVTQSYTELHGVLLRFHRIPRLLGNSKVDKFIRRAGTEIYLRFEILANLVLLNSNDNKWFVTWVKHIRPKRFVKRAIGSTHMQRTKSFTLSFEPFDKLRVNSKKA